LIGASSSMRWHSDGALVNAQISSRVYLPDTERMGALWAAQPLNVSAATHGPNWALPAKYAVT
jgi:hypothetical protein